MHLFSEKCMWLLMSQPYHLFCLCHHWCNLHYLCYLHSTSFVFPVYRIPFRSCRVDHSCCYSNCLFSTSRLVYQFQVEEKKSELCLLEHHFFFCFFCAKATMLQSSEYITRWVLAVVITFLALQETCSIGFCHRRKAGMDGRKEEPGLLMRLLLVMFFRFFSSSLRRQFFRV